MAESTFYVVNKDDCLTEGMSKEQILTAIEQSLEQGYVSNPDSAVFSKIKEIRANGTAQIWIGTEAQFNAISPAPTIGKSVVRIGENGVMYICSDDSTLNDLSNHLSDENNPHGVTFRQVAGADVLPTSKGGTGNTNGRAVSAASADKATKLANPRTIGVNLASGEAANFDGTSNVNPGVYGVLPLANGGLGATTPDGACSNIGALRMVQYVSSHKTKGGINDISAWIGYMSADESTTYNQMDLGKESTWFKQPVSISSGGTGNTTGTAQSALKLAQSCSVGVNLASGETASFNGTADITPGVYGVLPKANGGTGNTSGRAASADTATKLSNRRTIGVNLASGKAAYFDGTADIQPGVLGVLPLANGGLGATTPDDACANIGALRITRYSDNTNYSAGCGSSTMWFAYQQNGETKCQVDLWNGGALTVNGHIVYNNDNIKYSATEPEVWDGRIWLKPI